MKLRPYQSDIIAQASAAMARGIRTMVIESPTGSGKTMLTAHMIKTASERGMDCWFIVHRAELLRQSAEAFRSVGVDFGTIAAGSLNDSSRRVQICSVQALKRRMPYLRKPKLIIWDESHHLAAKGWASIFDGNLQAFHIGLSATPERLDGKGLGVFFKEMIRGPKVRWLIENGFLADYRLIVPPGSVSTDGVHRIAGDFNRAELAAAADTPTITGNAVREYLKYARGKRAIARGVSIVHSQHIAAEFNAAGIPALHVDGDTDPLERARAMESFVRGETLVLSNVDLFSEGVDVPAVECILDLRPTESVTLCLQFWGRGLRPAPGKTHAILIDMAGNLARHGLPCDLRDWSLEGRASKKGGTGRSLATRVCPKCYGAQIGYPPKCRFCGHVFETDGAREVQSVDAALVEVDVEKLRLERIEKKREQSQARTLAELIVLGKKRGYKNPQAWAHMLIKARGSRQSCGHGQGFFS